MQTTTYSRKFLLQRRFYTFLPLLVIPFITMLFWILIGKYLGKESNQPEGVHKGLLMKLPDAILKNDDAFNKLSYYKKAAADSARLRDLIAKDPYYLDTAMASADTLLGIPLKGLEGSQHKRKFRGTKSSQMDIHNQEQQMHSKLAELDKALTQTSHPGIKEKRDDTQTVRVRTDTDHQIQQLQKMMTGINLDESRAGRDPEMVELNNMLDKILEIQDPEKASDKLRAESLAHKKQVFPVLKSCDADPVTILQAGHLPGDSLAPSPVNYQNEGFYSLEDQQDVNSSQNAIEAWIDQTQKLVTGATVKLRLANDIFVSGERLSKGQAIFGTASLNQERLLVHIESIRNENSVFAVNLSVYDADGVEGIYIPGAISRDLTKQSADRTVQGLSIPITDPSLGAQAASAGIQAAKTFLGRKAKLVQVTVKAGYRVLLIDKNSRSN
ncbi:conjugative transposon protein TraM [Dyadobacter sp. 32]|uniref:conjugative transposon protein TraM n=1 Tax=Dyadobacter sp. 32 TaxID=538966 RepID=UPI0011EE3E78